MTPELLAQFGITKEEILDRVATHILEQDTEESGRAYAQREIAKQYAAGIQKAIDHTINASCAEALMLEFQPVNMWGEKTGKPTSVRDLFVKKCQDWWTQKVGFDGKPSDSYGNKYTMVEYHAEKAVKEIVDKEMKEALKQVVDEAKSKVSKAIGEYIQTHISKSL